MEPEPKPCHYDNSSFHQPLLLHAHLALPSSSSSSSSSFHPHLAHLDLPSSSSSSSSHPHLDLPSSSSSPPPPPPRRTKSNLHRARTAPSISVLTSSSNSPSSIDSPQSSSILLQAFIYLLAYLSVGVTVYCLSGPAGFTGKQTNICVDAIYFCIVTLCTIGYGDIAPDTAFTKAFSCLFVLIGFGLIDVFLSGAISYILDAQEAAILAGARGGVLVDAEKGRMRIRMKAW